MTNRKGKKQLGFTLIELTVSIFILAVISSIAVANYRAGEKRRQVSLAVDGIVNSVRLAQTYALTGKQIESTSCASKAPKDYRVNFSSSSEYVLYSDDTCGNSFELQRFSLPAQTQMKAGELRLNSASVNSLSIMFEPPFGRLTASTGGVFSSFTSASIGVEQKDGTVTKSATVDGVSGRIGE
ncbi:MAG: hypothetical protein A3E98_04185 [Candidatus Doudnabacteria bacterium RIFCSPHIGHO2_12_FULL_48_11]|uniref:General secretion pathway GspH domain-containing protein n=1 Tax=Candidatus Doudnabacteria bacterium RIFCSPHIGHO2_01_FULL_46_24 TaxID=1817825 RepID=A0A1F5NVI0_9BACT|nr:MAG: hypothetical protein A2720_00720 [Candidatus Doudnabacteria bacterium RIFCSPHIGHO2_01_FULL_46_24]OGE95992.1 MAG: hypothetical protein A3E98_04185 [Candidatus Doudnabacteria bacterium RIFCSPHIGHO2_12_FULL_48_11]